jgi:threonine/homoserine/homoserine lactone efflux protein
MENYALIGSILLIHAFRWLTPGPAIALIIRNSLVYSRKTGFLTAVGFAISNLIWITLAITGIAVLITKSPDAQIIIKYIGAGYLMYLGIKTFFLTSHLQNTETKEKHHDIRPIRAIKIGFLTNFFNPNAPLFFLSIFGSLLSSKAASWVILFLMIAMPLNSLIMASLWSLFFSHKKIKSQYAKFQPILNKVLGGVLVLLAIKIILI